LDHAPFDFSNAINSCRLDYVVEQKPHILIAA
jgi:hypothetical protein